MMKLIFKLLQTGLMLAAMSASAQDAIFKPYGEGLPLPWPFPWAKECPVDWESMEGRYQLSNSSASEEIDFQITVITKRGYRLVRVSHYSSDGVLVAEGATFVARDQRSIHVWLNPTAQFDGTRTSAMLQLYFPTATRECGQQLIPILTLDHYRRGTHVQTRYRLVRMDQFPR